MLCCSINVSMGPQERRRLATGIHTVCDIFCTVCRSYLGWFYVEAVEQSEKYKIGNFVLERRQVELFDDEANHLAA